MEDIVKRLKYYNGQFLQQQDFTDEQEYLLDRTRRHNAQLHTPGIAKGLTVTINGGSKSVSVAPGTALNSEGQLIVLKDPFNVGFETEFHGHTVLVVISYHDEPSDEATVGDVGMTRWLERPEIRVFRESQAPAADLSIRLARLQLDGNGNITSHDTSVRTPSGAKVLPHETFESLRLSRQGVNANLWPVLTSGAAQQADLAGNLSVNGNILVTGTVDGRDVSADGTANDAHRSSTNNPHAVTAAQVGALVSVEGVSNAGGNIDLIGASGIAVAGNNTNKTITITGSAPSTIASVSNPGGDIAITGAGGIAVAGNNTTKTITITGNAPSSIDGVSNPGGTIDFVGSGGISIAPDNGAAKRITFSTSASAIGALPAGDYMRRVVTSGSIGQFETTKSVNCGFLPKYIAINWSAYGQFNGRIQGVNSTAFVDVWGPGSWNARGTYQHIARLSGAPYWDSNAAGGYSTLYWIRFRDYTTNPVRLTEVQVTLDSVSGSGFVLRQTKISYAMTIELTFHLVVLG